MIDAEIAEQFRLLQQEIVLAGGGSRDAQA
jgi:hypothetical protein